MKVLLICLLIISTILTIGLVYYLYKNSSYGKEGFQSEEAPNALLSLVANVKRINKYLINPETWIERFELLRMSPVELARRELNKPKPKQLISNGESE
jgi:hypothetical protein